MSLQATAKEAMNEGKMMRWKDENLPFPLMPRGLCTLDYLFLEVSCGDPTIMDWNKFQREAEYY